MTRPFDGRRMAAILVAGFSVVIAVNVYAAVVAKRTFGGVVVENSYVASQNYNRWLHEASSERALGWRAEPRRLADGRIAVRLSGAPAGASIAAEARHPLGQMADRTLAFGADGVSRQPLPAGRWILRITVSAAGKQVRSEGEVS